VTSLVALLIFTTLEQPRNISTPQTFNKPTAHYTTQLKLRQAILFHLFPLKTTSVKYSTDNEKFTQKHASANPKVRNSVEHLHDLYNNHKQKALPNHSTVHSTPTSHELEIFGLSSLNIASEMKVSPVFFRIRSKEISSQKRRSMSLSCFIS
jgi:hypothetical protein